MERKERKNRRDQRDQDIIDKCTVTAFFCNREVTCLRDIKGININSRECEEHYGCEPNFRDVVRL